MPDFDIKRYLTEDMGFSAEEAETMSKNFTPERVSKVANRYVAPEQKERLASIDKDQAALAAAEARLNSEIAEWSALTAAEQATNSKMRDDLDAAQRRAYELQQKLTRTAEAAGIDPRTLIEEPLAAPVKKEERVADPIDTKQFVSKQDFGNVAAFQMELPAALQFIADSHRELTGERLDTREIVKEIRARAGKADANVDPVSIWREKYGIDAKEQAKASADLAAKLKAADDNGYERGRSEASIPHPSLPGRQAPVFTIKDGAGAPRTSRLSRPAPESTVTAAAQALRSGQYRQAAGR